MRWKLTLRYLGTRYSGWQKQPDDPTVQQVVEESLSTILREPIEVVGCGRTDAGVHARNYVAHFEADSIPDFAKVIYQLNAILPTDIAVYGLEEATAEFHARFDALDRTYRYYLHFDKNPFLQDVSFYFSQGHDVDSHVLHQSAALLLDYQHFQPFCKTGSDADHFKCTLIASSWQWENDKAVFTIKANRFLRGMVRLVVGSSLNVGLGKISIEQMKLSLDQQSPMPMAWSVPPQGLFLEEINYPS